jgi:hypothetical protein
MNKFAGAISILAVTFLIGCSNAETANQAESLIDNGDMNSLEGDAMLEHCRLMPTIPGCAEILQKSGNAVEGEVQAGQGNMMMSVQENFIPGDVIL